MGAVGPQCTGNRNVVTNQRERGIRSQRNRNTVVNEQNVNNVSGENDPW